MSRATRRHSVILRQATPEDAAALSEVFHRAIREGPSPYSEAQRAAWSPRCPTAGEWRARLAELETVLGHSDDRVLGFMSVDAAGYVDLAFILPEARGSGLFRHLYGAVETIARGTGNSRLRTHASLAAQAAFRSVGFRVIQHEEIQRRGQRLPRAEMEKWLT